MFNVFVFIFCINSFFHLVTNEVVGSSGNDTNSFLQISKPPIDRVLKVYIYNVTNPEEFVKNGSEAIVKELGPYVYVRTWAKGNDQGKFGQEEFYKFDETLSNGREDDLVVVPDIMKLLRILTNDSRTGPALSVLDDFFKMLHEEPFVNLTVKQFLWGSESQLLNISQPEIFEKIYKGAIHLLDSQSIDFIKYVVLDKINTTLLKKHKMGALDRGASANLKKQYLEVCKKRISLDGSDYPGYLKETRIIHAVNENFCKTIPLSYEKSISEKDDVTAYRFVANIDMFSKNKLIDNPCDCDLRPLCIRFYAADTIQCGLVSLFPLSFPHFYLSDNNHRMAVEGISPPDPEKHKFYIDVQPATGIAVNVKARLQLNVAMLRVIKNSQGSLFPYKIAFPIMWFEEGSH